MNEFICVSFRMREEEACVQKQLNHHLNEKNTSEKTDKHFIKKINDNYNYDYYIFYFSMNE